MTRILVTGATGFIGTHLAAKCRSQQYDVIAANSESGDVTDSSTWKAFPDCQVVIHLAARTFVPDSWVDPAGFLHTNLHGTVCALEYCRQRHARLIFMSSYLYGVPEKLPIPETASLHASNPYALSKKLAEETCRFYTDHFGVAITILRPFNVYGPGQDPKFLIPSIVEQTLDGVGLTVKDLEPRRDYLYIDDLTDAVLSAIDKPQRFGVFNIASGTSHSVSEVLAVIQRVAGKNLPIRCEGVRRKQEVMDTRADITRAVEILGWRPRWSLSAGCAEMIQAKHGVI